MKCPHCKKDFENGVKAAYKLGLLDGENRLQRTIKIIKATHRELLNELLRLDKVEPVAKGEAILLPMPMVRKIIKHLNKVAPWYAIKLKALVNKQRPDMDDILTDN